MAPRIGLRLTSLWQHNLLPKTGTGFRDHAVPATLTCWHPAWQAHQPVV
jgi:hypothetical protein